MEQQQWLLLLLVLLLEVLAAVSAGHWCCQLAGQRRSGLPLFKQVGTYLFTMSAWWLSFLSQAGYPCSSLLSPFSPAAITFELVAVTAFIKPHLPGDCDDVSGCTAKQGDAGCAHHSD
jgi:hypothetical protein